MSSWQITSSSQRAFFGSHLPSQLLEVISLDVIYRSYLVTHCWKLWKSFQRNIIVSGIDENVFKISIFPNVKLCFWKPRLTKHTHIAMIEVWSYYDHGHSKIMILPRSYHGDHVSYYDHTMTIMFHIMNIVWKPCFKRINVVRMSDMAATCSLSSQKLLARVLMLYF